MACRAEYVKNIEIFRADPGDARPPGQSGAEWCSL